MGKLLFAGSVAVLATIAAVITATGRKQTQVVDIRERARLARVVH